MDQLKKQLAVVLVHGFWIASGIVLIGSVLIWYMTTGKLADENTSATSQLNNAHMSVDTVSSEMDSQPNEHTHKEMNVLIESRRDELMEAWSSLYERQRSILTWSRAELTDEFVDEFEDLIPIEVSVEYPTLEKDEKEASLRYRYKRYIGESLPEIAKIANTEWTADFKRSASAMGGPSGEMGSEMMMMAGMPGGPQKDINIRGQEDGPLVKWSTTSQNAVLDDLFPWRSSPDPPSTLEVYYSQENIWILKQLLQIVADVNGDARQPYQAKIREIRNIGIGSSVKFDSGQIAKPGEGMTAGGGMYSMEMMDGSDMMAGMDSMAMMGAGGPEVQSPDPGENRYVDAEMQPVAASALRTALTSNSPADAEIAVAKRVPVMMSVQIDQRALQQFLAACGSAPLMVEVRQVRVLPKAGSSTLGGEMMGMGMEMMGGEMDMMGGEMEMMGGEMGMGMGMNMMNANKTPAEEDPYDMTVEVYGLIYIYNPPSDEKLGLDKVDQNTQIDGSAGGATVAAPAPATTTDTDVLPTPAGDDPAVPDPNQTNPAPAADPTQPTPDPNQPDPNQPAPAQPGGDNTQPGDNGGQPPVAETGTVAPPPAVVIAP